MNSQSRNKMNNLCKFHGSAIGCTRKKCPFDHSNPNSIPLCRYKGDGKQCKRGKKCRFRHKVFAQSAPKKSAIRNKVNRRSTSKATLLDGVPKAIITIIFELVQSMECHDISDALTTGFHQQLAFEFSLGFYQTRRSKRSKGHQLHRRQNAFRFADSVVITAANNESITFGFGDDNESTQTLEMTPGFECIIS